MQYKLINDAPSDEVTETLGSGSFRPKHGSVLFKEKKSELERNLLSHSSPISS